MGIPVEEVYHITRDLSLFEIAPPFPKLKLELEDALAYEKKLMNIFKFKFNNQTDLLTPHYHVSTPKSVSNLTVQQFRKIFEMYKALNATYINAYLQHDQETYPKPYAVFVEGTNGYYDIIEKANVKYISNKDYYHLEIRNLHRIAPDQRKLILKDVDKILQMKDYRLSTDFIADKIIKFLKNENTLKTIEKGIILNNNDQFHR